MTTSTTTDRKFEIFNADFTPVASFDTAEETERYLRSLPAASGYILHADGWSYDGQWWLDHECALTALCAERERILSDLTFASSAAVARLNVIERELDRLPWRDVLRATKAAQALKAQQTAVA